MKRSILLFSLCFITVFMFMVTNAADAQDPKPPEKITKGWLWMSVPTSSPGGADALKSKVDWLKEASGKLDGGKVTEAKVAANGVKAGDKVGDLQWAKSDIAAVGDDNVNDVMVKLGFGKVKGKLQSDIDDAVSYGVITIDSPKEQKAALHTGSDDAIQVWLDGKSIQRVEKNRGAGNYQEKKEITLKEGESVLMVAVYEKGGGWSQFVGIDADFTTSGGQTFSGSGPAPPVPGPKIQDWLWMAVPSTKCGKDATTTDWLAEASGGEVTEKSVAAGRARAGQTVGKLKWTAGKIAAGSDNVNDLMVKLNLAPAASNNIVSYAATHIYTPGGKTNLHTGSDDAIKVWINGVVVQEVKLNRGADNYKEKKEITLKSGHNLLLVAVYECTGGWSQFVGFDEGITYEAIAPVEPRDKLVTTWGKLKSL